MGKIVRLNENDIEKLVKKIIKEEDYDANETEHSSRYMFFSNLQQLNHIAKMVLKIVLNITFLFLFLFNQFLNEFATMFF